MLTLIWAVSSVNLKKVELARLEKVNFTGLTHKPCANSWITVVEEQKNMYKQIHFVAENSLKYYHHKYLRK